MKSLSINEEFFLVFIVPKKDQQMNADILERLKYQFSRKPYAVNGHDIEHMVEFTVKVSLGSVSFLIGELKKLD